ncbi:ArsR family transcriptional regulator [Salinarchaeum laminariae]|uniref:ArsR family transcriptional regulator n=1 Tax=Salinarchaeum laminariae TaxID=869888 RepID=UPI0020C01A4A
MTRADDAILEFLLNEVNRSLVASPSTIEANIEYGLTHVRRRLRELDDGDLLEYYDRDRGLYQITERGCAYLDGEISADELKRND